MSVDFKKLKSFVKIVDTGSVSRAAGILRVAQPALSQQIASLEQHFNHQLLLRSNVGITPTEAGMILYRHAQIMLKQIEQAQTDIDRSARSISGRVSIGLATYSSSSALSLPLIKEMRARFPAITVHINDSFGHILSELIMTGKMDMALIYTSDPIKGVTLEPLFREEMFLVSPTDMVLPAEPGQPLPLSVLDGRPMLLPSKAHFLRRLIDEGLARAREAGGHFRAGIRASARGCGIGRPRFDDPSGLGGSGNIQLQRCAAASSHDPCHRCHGFALCLRSHAAFRTGAGGAFRASRNRHEAEERASSGHSCRVNSL